MNTTYLLFLAVLASGFAQAKENRWANRRRGGKWENGANWSLDIPPKINHDVGITSALSETVAIEATTAALPNNMVVSNAMLRAGNGVLRLEGGTVVMYTIDPTSPWARFEHTGIRCSKSSPSFLKAQTFACVGRQSVGRPTSLKRLKDLEAVTSLRTSRPWCFRAPAAEPTRSSKPKAPSKAHRGFIE